MIKSTDIESPFTGGKVRLCTEMATIEFRGESYSVERVYYVCEDTGVDFTTTELDEKNMEAVYRQYRDKYGIPSPSEIKSIRKSYGLPASAMSKVLGLGTNQYGQYEAGVVPTVSVGRLVMLAADFDNMRQMLLDSRKAFSEKEYSKYFKEFEASRVSKSYETLEIGIGSFESIQRYIPSGCLSVSLENVGKESRKESYSGFKSLSYAC